MGSSKIKTVDMSEGIDETTAKKTKKTDSAKKEAKSSTAAETNATATPSRTKSRSKKYQHQRSQVDKTKLYPAPQAVELVKKLGSKKHPTITADVNYKESNFQTEITFPHSTGKTITVAIADDDVLTQIEKGKIDFDILLAKPDMMGKIAKHARVLGPRGLMPNPKNNTVTANPEKRKKELESGKITVKTEKKAPLLHIQIGTKDMDDKQLIENLQTLVKHLNSSRIARLTISSTMSPGVKVDVTSLITE